MEGEQKRGRGRPRLARDSDEAASVQSLDRGLALLALLAECDGLSLSEVSGTAGVPLSTTYRMLTTLQRRGLVELEAGTQLWHVGVESFRIGAAFLVRRKLAERGRQAMQDLVARCGETANLAVAEEDSVVFVSQVETHAAIRAFFRPGTRSAMHASGVGKAILAHLPGEQVAAIARRAGLPGYTPRTLTELGALRAELAVALGRGFAVDDEERHAGMRCVAAAIFNEFGEPVAGVSLSGPSVRVTPAAVEEFGPLVAAAAADITRWTGGRLPAVASAA